MRKYLKTITIAMLLTFGVATAAEAASWRALKWAQCYRLGGSYCR
jgi:hypothetical protein